MLSESASESRAASAARLVRTVRRSFRAFAGAADRLHGDLGVTAAMRVVLELLDENGPMTVPQMARVRGVSRQHFQAKTDLLLARGLVEGRPNPAHARSKLIALTARGRAVFSEMRRRESAVFARAAEGLDETEIEAARRSLEKLAASIEAAVDAEKEAERRREKSNGDD